MQLVTLFDVKRHVNVTASTDDNELAAVAEAAEALVFGQCRPILAQTIVTEPLDVSPTGLVLLPDYPVNSITAVTDSTGIAVTFTARPSSGRVYVTTTGPVTVTYTVGFATVPADVREATLIVVGHLWESQRGRRTRTRFAVEDAPDPLVGPSLPSTARDLLRPYLRPASQAA